MRMLFMFFRAFLASVLLLFSCSIQALVVVRMETVLGEIDLELYDEVAPKTVENFLEYVDRQAYDGTFIHRSVPGFIIQGGGFFLNDGVGEHIPVDPPVVNEFNISNTRGTIAMAKLGGDPNSATSEWFFNLADNSANLDGQNGGFAVFGRVLGDGMEVVDAIAALPTVNAGGPFGDLPVRDYASGDLNESHYVFLNRVFLLQQLVATSVLDYGTVRVGTSVERDVTVLNQGVDSVTIGTVTGLDGMAPPFGIVSDGCSGQVLAAGMQCLIRLRFEPQALGVAEDSFNIPYIDPDPDPKNLYVQLHGDGMPPLTTDPRDRVAMGLVELGESRQRTLTLTNDGGIVVTVTDVAISGQDAALFLQQHDCGLLSPGGSCEVSITFTPDTRGQKEAMLSIHTDYAPQGLIQVELGGRGQDSTLPALGVSTLNLGFGEVYLGFAKPLQLTMISGGGSDLLVSAISIRGPDADAFETTRHCVGALAPDERCTETITFTPLTAGEKSATLVIASNDPDAPEAEINLTGFGRDAGNRVELEAPGGGKVVLLTVPGAELQDVAVVQILPEADMPEGIDFRHGYYQFKLILPVGASFGAVAISFPAGDVPVTYYKYGRTPDNATPHWYEFMWDPETQTGAVIQGNVVTLYFVDGERGDDDLTVDGLIVDPGAPGFSATGSPPGGAASSGGGCVMQVHPRAPWSSLDLLLVALFVTLLGVYRGVWSGAP